jgi:hypothetical protein
MPGGEHVSTRIEGAIPPVIRIAAKATLAAGDNYLILTVTVTEENTDLWRCSPSRGDRDSRGVFGRIVAGCRTALRRAAEICTDGYQPGSTGRGLPAIPAETTHREGEERT